MLERQMELKGTKTERNLWAAFAAESQARNRYIYFADAARETGHHDVADVFYELAANEGEHAKKEFEFLGGIDDVRSNVEKAAGHEHHEHEKVYPEFARVAREEGFPEIADFFERMSKVEGTHEQRCLDLLKSLDGIEQFQGRTVLRSAIAMAQTTLPNQANIAGFVHGGDLMKMMDSAARGGSRTPLPKERGYCQSAGNQLLPSGACRKHGTYKRSAYLRQPIFHGSTSRGRYRISP